MIDFDTFLSNATQEMATTINVETRTNQIAVNGENWYHYEDVVEVPKHLQASTVDIFKLREHAGPSNVWYIPIADEAHDSGLYTINIPDVIRWMDDSVCEACFGRRFICPCLDCEYTEAVLFKLDVKRFIDNCSNPRENFRIVCPLCMDWYLSKEQMGILNNPSPPKVDDEVEMERRVQDRLKELGYADKRPSR